MTTQIPYHHNERRITFQDLFCPLAIYITYCGFLYTILYVSSSCFSSILMRSLLFGVVCEAVNRSAFALSRELCALWVVDPAGQMSCLIGDV